MFTLDAVSMFTNIDTDAALSIICPCLHEKEKDVGHYHAEMLICALEIVTKKAIQYKS